ncbi:MAG TPA: glycoside hydrolase family 2 TIM barrel-domain containing protein [Balneolaceae bacterium]|nr:glycoside hydrolase family 2 TIM barrel-domain containing protein [Balneolaceae bacterium]
MPKKLKVTLLIYFLLSAAVVTKAQEPLITDIPARKTVSLDGKWAYIMDPYETGFYDYRYKELAPDNPNAYWNSDQPQGKYGRKEFGYDTARYSLHVPGDWNSQDPKFLYYEGSVWYKKTFDYNKSDPSNRLFLYFGAVNYRADVYLNGRKLGMHKGGFTPFNFEIPDSLLKKKGNSLVVHVNNNRSVNEVPTVNYDWWNYGGITRSVKLVEVPHAFIRDFFIHLKRPAAGQAPDSKNAETTGWIKFAGDYRGPVIVEIPELNFKKVFQTNGRSKVPVSFTLQDVQFWSPKNPKRYRVVISAGKDRVEDKIGFRTIEAHGQQVLLNGKRLFMRGIAIHEEIPQEGRRAHSKKDALQLLGWAKELNCNMVRLAHYPHNENMIRAADSLGVLVWSEIPVYWTIDFGNKAVYEKAKQQLTEMITRDRNRANVIIWSVGNETPVSPKRTNFMHNLITEARKLDPTRMVSAALEVNYNSGKAVNLIDDPLGKYVDLVAFNEYLGWYGSTPDECRTTNWDTPYDKPLFISETGAGAKGGFHSKDRAMWSEEYQEWYYKEQLAMLKRMPAKFSGISPWILADFRSPKRNNPVYQEGWNRKGLISSDGKKKKAFFILKAFYDKIEANGGMFKN